MRPAMLPVPELSRRLAAGELTSMSLVEDCLARIRERDGLLHAFLSVDEEGARAAAAASDERAARRQRRGALDGIPIALKDNLALRGLPTTCGSRLLAEYRSPYDATVVTKLKAAGCPILGKTNLDEFAMGSSTEYSAFGTTRHPADPSRVPGGSSGGSCVAVADGMAPLALGSDTGGSVRLPASWCGVVGLKPTWGRVSRSGLVAFASSLDQIGPVARTVAGCAALLDVIAGHDPRDATSLRDAPGDPFDAIAGDVSGLRVGLVPELLGEGVDAPVRASVQAAAAAFERLGARLVETHLPHARYAIAAYYVVAGAEASSNLARFDGARYGRRAAAPADLEDLYSRSRSEGFGDEVKRRILVGTFALSAGYHDAYYERATKARALIARDYRDAFAHADVLLSPVAPGAAFRVGERVEDPLAMYLTDAMTIPASLAGIPAISVPGGAAKDGLPLGVQLTAPFRGERTLLRAAAALERATFAGAPPGAA
ncbi:MAG: Asp-tRNA(Asn)/Glu-tRNA(Gln) amidotransferase subunit GatA [bacterium]